MNSFGINGLMSTVFSEHLHPLDEAGLNLTTLNLIKESVLSLNYVSQGEGNEDQHQNIPSLDAWEFVSFSSQGFELQINFTNPLYVSALDDKDKLSI